MKKLLLLLGVAAMIVGTQAATVSWVSGAGMKGPGGSYMAAGAIKMYVFEFASEEAYNAATIASLDVSTAKLSGATTKSTTGITLKDETTYGAGDTIYSAVLFTVTEDGKDYFMGQKLTSTVDDLGSAVSFASLKNTSGAWTQSGGGGDIPEPTSGLLLLVGAGMLALRRKQK